MTDSPAQNREIVELTEPTSGLRLIVDEASNRRAVRIFLPGQAGSDPGILVIFPEHVTAREAGKAAAEHLYLFRGPQPPVLWRVIGQALQYETDFPAGVTMIARATLEPDGVRYTYRFTNKSTAKYDMIQAVTDPRMITPYFRDVRLTRTYVHHKGGFDLLASETPERLDKPLEQWLPNRYRASYTWPVDSERVARQPDGVTWYNKSRVVDEPFIATKSIDGKWLVATFSYDPGNVWSNPELTCQHADPKVSLEPGQSAVYEVKMLIIRGRLEDVLSRVREQRAKLAH